MFQETKSEVKKVNNAVEQNKSNIVESPMHKYLE